MVATTMTLEWPCGGVHKFLAPSGSLHFWGPANTYVISPESLAKKAFFGDQVALKTWTPHTKFYGKSSGSVQGMHWGRHGGPGMGSRT